MRQVACFVVNKVETCVRRDSFVFPIPRYTWIKMSNNVTDSPSVEDITITTPVSLGVANYILIVFSVLAGAAFTFGVGLLVYREYKRNKDVKVSRFKERLNVRRKGISGMSSVYTMERFDTVSSLESTSYLQLSVSPTSGFGSQDGTPISSKFKDKFR